MITLLFTDVHVTAVADTPVLILREANGPRIVPVWVSAVGANAVLAALEPDDPQHPATHDLVVELLSALDGEVEEVHLTGFDDGVFTAEVVVGGVAVASRVSDAVALSLRSGAPILATRDVMELAAIVPVDRDAPSTPDSEMAEFRAFLDTITPDDFSPGDPQV